MKLNRIKSKKVPGKNISKKKIATLIVVAILLTLALLITVVVLTTINNNKEKEAERAKLIQGINIAVYPNKTEYYIGDSFDSTGTKVQVVTNSQEYTYFVDWTQLTFEGFDSNVVNEELPITVSYKGYTTKFYVTIKEQPQPTPTLERIEVYNFKTEYKLKTWNMGGPDTTGGRIRAYYSDGSVVEDIVLKDKYIPGYDQLDAPGTTEITVKYNDGVTTVETTVTITVTE